MYKMNFGQRSSNFFRKASPVFNNLFQQGRTIASKASMGLGHVGRYLDVGSTIASKIANNPALTSIQNPELQHGLSLLQKASDVARKGSNFAHNADKFVNEGTYQNGHEANITNALERAKGLRKEGANIYR